jgi:hypothetical protein
MRLKLRYSATSSAGLQVPEHRVVDLPDGSAPAALLQLAAGARRRAVLLFLLKS